LPKPITEFSIGEIVTISLFFINGDMLKPLTWNLWLAFLESAASKSAVNSIDDKEISLDFNMHLPFTKLLAHCRID
jgi:hypothetical protein